MNVKDKKTFCGIYFQRIVQTYDRNTAFHKCHLKAYNLQWRLLQMNPILREVLLEALGHKSRRAPHRHRWVFAGRDKHKYIFIFTTNTIHCDGCYVMTRMKFVFMYVCMYVCHSITWVQILRSYLSFVQRWTCFRNRHLLNMSRIRGKLTKRYF